MRGAVQVLVERGERRERAVAQVALVARPVPGLLRRPVERRALPLPEEPRGVRDDPVLVEARHDAIHHVARDARGTRAGLEVVDERGAGDEGLCALLHWTVHGAPLMESGSLVVTQRVVVLERTSAGDAVHIGVVGDAVPVEAAQELEHL